MKNFLKPGGTIDVLLTATVLSGAMILVGAMCVVAEVGGVNTETIACKTEGVFEIPKAAGAIGQGAILYWDDTAKNLTTSSNSGANVKAGYAFRAALTGDTTAFIQLGR